MGGVDDLSFSFDFDGFAKPVGGQLGDGAFPVRVSNSRIFINDNKVSLR